MNSSSVNTKTCSSTIMNGAKEMFLGSPLKYGLPCVIFGMTSYYNNWNPAITFTLSLIGIAPLAERLGFCTEQMAMHTNDTIGGLLNATFGNATELIVAITCLQKGLYRVVQLSLLGSVLSNILLVLGCAFFAGGIKYKIQTHNPVASQVNAAVLFFSTMALVASNALIAGNEENNGGELALSRAISFVMIGVYVVYIYFQMYSHAHLYETPEQVISPIVRSANPPIPMVTNEEHSEMNNSENDAKPGTLERSGSYTRPSLRKALSAGNKSISDIESVQRSSDEDDEEEDILGFWPATVWLTIITIFIAILSEALSSTIEKAGTSYGISGDFLSAIILPIVGNAAEHASAIVFARKDKLDISIGIAIGSSCQISSLVIPVLVILGWIMNKPLSLNFGYYESSSMFMAVLIAMFMMNNGQSNYLLGVILIGAYFMVSVGFAVHYNENLN